MLFRCSGNNMKRLQKSVPSTETVVVMSHSANVNNDAIRNVRMQLY